MSIGGAGWGSQGRSRRAGWTQRLVGESEKTNKNEREVVTMYVLGRAPFFSGGLGDVSDASDAE